MSIGSWQWLMTAVACTGMPPSAMWHEERRPSKAQLDVAPKAQILQLGLRKDCSCEADSTVPGRAARTCLIALSALWPASISKRAATVPVRPRPAAQCSRIRSPRVIAENHSAKGESCCLASNGAARSLTG